MTNGIDMSEGATIGACTKARGRVDGITKEEAGGMGMEAGVRAGVIIMVVTAASVVMGVMLAVMGVLLAVLVVTDPVDGSVRTNKGPAQVMRPHIRESRGLAPAHRLMVAGLMGGEASCGMEWGMAGVGGVLPSRCTSREDIDLVDCEGQRSFSRDGKGARLRKSTVLVQAFRNSVCEALLRCSASERFLFDTLRAILEGGKGTLDHGRKRCT